MSLPLLRHAFGWTLQPLGTHQAPQLGFLAFAALGLLCPPTYSADPGAAKPAKAARTQKLTKTGKGTLLLVGGGPIPASVCERFFELAGGKKAKIVVIPTASARAESYTPASSTLWAGRDTSTVAVLHTCDRKQADDPAFFKVLEEATAVWVSGGDQSRLTEVYCETAFLIELRKFLERGGVIGGTSAGASVMSSTMITGGTTKASIGAGFGFIPGMIIDQHFTRRNRMGRLSGLVNEHTDKIGLGIDESTAAEFQGDTLSILGNANAYLYLAPMQQPTDGQRLKAGDRVDLLTLNETLLARAKPAKETPAVTTGGMTTPMVPMIGTTGFK